MGVRGGRFLRGWVADQLEHQARQMKDKASPLLRVELGIDAWKQVRFRAPQFQLIRLHVGSPGLRRW